MRVIPFLGMLVALTCSTLARSQPYLISVLEEGGNSLPTFEHQGRTYVLGAKGQRYLIHFRNNSPRRVEVVTSVDGRDVIDGKPSGWEKRGYLVAAYGEITIDGYRLNQEAVAAFRFGSVSQSYSALMGDARDVGVIGVAVFPERPPRTIPPPVISSFGMMRSDRQASGAPAAPPSASEHLAKKAAPAEERAGLGTEFGEEHGSHVSYVAFERASSRPEVVLSVRYNDRQGLLALGIDVDRHHLATGDEQWVRETAEPFRRDPSFADPPPGWQR